MENDQKETLTCGHPSLADQVASEYDLCLLLGVSATTLDNLRRNRGLPYIPLNRNNRVYKTEEVLKWLSSLTRA